ncbi:ATP-dependent DNA helicase [Methanoregula sp.]|uniref:ATP-dependent DNA helicase n=1 Tax=Methanoregula sp. TaxID=2052170 RepID=UPI003565EF54
MDSFDPFFPYAEYRPHQREMLAFAAEVAREGGIGMIDAPTGSGKSSVVASLLAERKNRKIVIAVRTVSQLTTFIRELALVKKKQPKLKIVYLVGKKSMCPLGGEGDVYRRCEGVKTFSSSLMRDRAEKGALVPIKDPFIVQQIRRMDREHPLICPYFIASKMFVPGDTGGLKMVPSTTVRSKSERVLTDPVRPQELAGFAGDICPYELMMHAAKNADVIILNYHHLFDREIREQLYANLNVESQDVMLLIDEAHNCGDTIQSIESIGLAEKDLEQAIRELSGMKRHHKGAEAVQHVLPRLTEFIRGLANSTEPEDWFDPGIFDRMIVKGSLWKDMDDIVDELMGLAETIRDRNQKAGEFRETAIERLTVFMYRLSQSSNNPAYLTVYKRTEEGIILEVRNIDPSAPLTEICSSHACCIMISGTLSPVESYRRLYFNNAKVATLALPNSFPKKNRLICCATDITTAYSLRQNKENTDRIVRYIAAFAALKKNRAIYFPSYQILESYASLAADTISRRKIYIEPRDAAGAGAVLNEFLSLPTQGESGIMFAVCGGKWSEGLDYRGEMLAGAMVIGLPLAPFNRVRKMVIEYFRHKYGEEGEFLCYTLPAINKALQALGRVLRTPEDRGVLVLGERRFLEKRVKSALPVWIQEEMIECDSTQFREVIAKWK